MAYHKLTAVLAEMVADNDDSRKLKRNWATQFEAETLSGFEQSLIPLTTKQLTTLAAGGEEEVLAIVEEYDLSDFNEWLNEVFEDFSFITRPKTNRSGTVTKKKTTAKKAPAKKATAKKETTTTRKKATAKKTTAKKAATKKTARPKAEGFTSTQTAILAMMAEAPTKPISYGDIREATGIQRGLSKAIKTGEDCLISAGLVDMVDVEPEEGKRSVQRFKLTTKGKSAAKKAAKA